ncbi:MAG: hypothetical protein IJ433_02730 [Ruminococcus sp.]|nr:hypothetical protein [Ruminococcus sp.]
MKDKLQNAFKETPERFSYVIDNALCQAKLKKTKNRLSTPLKVVIAVVLIFAVLPSAVFGATKLYGAVAQRVGNFGVSLDISINEDVPRYVKMSVDVPTGFKEQPNSAGLKYDRDNEEREFGFTILPMRFYESVNYVVLEENVKDYNKMMIASRTSYELIGTDDYHGLRRYYVWYEEANVLILIYRGETVTDSELEAFVDCISFEQGTEADHDSFFEPERNAREITTDTGLYEYELELIEMPKDTKVLFAGFNEEADAYDLEVESKITDIRITDNINGIDESCINSLYDLSEVADANGNLLPRTVEVWQEGDGVNTETILLSSESKEQKLILVDIEYKNTAGKEVAVYVPHRLETIVKDAIGCYYPANQIDKYQHIYANEYCDLEMFYLSRHGDSEKDFYIPKLAPNETATITIGYRCIEEQLPNAYIVMNPFTDGIIAPEYSGSNNTYYIFKVQ